MEAARIDTSGRSATDGFGPGSVLRIVPVAVTVEANTGGVYAPPGTLGSNSAWVWTSLVFPDGLLRVSVNVSPSSLTVSSVIGTEMVFTFSPTLKVSVPVVSA